MANCKYLAPNGEPSILFNSLYNHYKNGYANLDDAEEKAVSKWLLTHSDSFKATLGDNGVLDANGEPRLIVSDEGKDAHFQTTTKEGILPIYLYEVGWTKPEQQRIFAMAERVNTGTLYNDATYGNDFGPFYMRGYNQEALRNGTKTISIRPAKLQSGVYKLGDDFYRVTTRGFKTIDQLKEKPETIQHKFIGSNEVKYSHIKEFFAGHLPMYVYDIKKLDEKDYPQAMAMADFVGNMKLTNADPEAKLVTGDNVFDRYVTAVNDYISRLEDERRKVKADKHLKDQYTERIEKQKKILKRLQSNKTVRALVEVGTEQITDVKTFSLKPDASLLEQVEGMRIAKAWMSLTEIIDLNKEGKTDRELEVVENGRQLEWEAHQLNATLWNRIKQEIVDIGEKNNIDLNKILVNGEFVFKDVDRFGAETLSSGYSTNPLEQLMTALQQNNLSKNNKEHYDFLTEADRVTAELLGSKDADTSFLKEEYLEDASDENGKIIKIKKEGIITMHSREFDLKHLELKHKAELGETTWKEFYEFERNHYTYNLTDEGKRDWELYKEQIRNDHKSYDANGEEVFDEAAIAAKLDKYDPEVFQAYLDDNKKHANSGGIWFNKIPKDNIPFNPKYTALTDKQKQYHEWFTNHYAEAHQNSVFDYRMGNADIDELLMGFSKDVDKHNMAKYIGNAAIDWLKDTVTVVAGSTKGSVITRPLTGKEHIKIPFKNIIHFIPEGNKKIHPLHVLKDFKAASTSFKNKREIEELMNVINDIGTIANKRETNNSGLEKDDRAGGILATKSPTHIKNRIEYTVKQFLTGRGNEPNTTSNKGIAPGERGFSWGQTFDSLNKLTRVRYMALSPLSAAGNFIMGAVNNLTYAADGRYFTDKELAKAVWMMKGAPMKFVTEALTGNKIAVASKETHLIAELMYANNMIGDVTEKLVYGESALNKLYALQKGGEFLVQGAATLAQMLHTPVTLKDGSKSNLFKMYKQDENGRVHFQKELLADDDPYQNDEALFKFYQIAKAVNEKIHGDYNNPLLGKKTVAGRALFLFRTWLPMSIKERFGAEYEHRLLGTQKGRYVSAFDVARSVVFEKGKNGETGTWKFDASNLGNLAKMFIKMIPGLNHKVKLSDRIPEIDRRNVDMFVREVQMMIMITMACMMAKSGASDDEDDEYKGFITYLYNQGERIQSELSFYYTPSSFNQVFQSIVPMTSTIMDAEKMISASIAYINDPAKDVYQRGFRKGDSKAGTAIKKFLPLTRSAESVWSAFSNLHNTSYSK